jgi:hypothetical protein
MRPHLDRTGFGWLEIEGERHDNDVLIRLDGSIEKRKKKLSKQIYGTSHTISLAEAEHIAQEGATVLVIGSGQYDRVRLSEEATEYFRQEGIEVRLLATPDAIDVWNDAADGCIGLFHLTC